LKALKHNTKLKESWTRWLFGFETWNETYITSFETQDKMDRNLHRKLWNIWRHEQKLAQEALKHNMKLKESWMHWLFGLESWNETCTTSFQT
jgi:hypothetical protein